jgi:hypothetical protein
VPVESAFIAEGTDGNIFPIAIPKIIAKKIQAVKYLSKNESFLPVELFLF